MPRAENQPRREPRPESKPATFLDLKPVMSAIDRLVPAKNPQDETDMTQLMPVDDLREFSVDREIFEDGIIMTISMIRPRFDLGANIEESETWLINRSGDNAEVNRFKDLYNPNENNSTECGCPDKAAVDDFLFKIKMGLNIVSKEESQKMAQMLNRTTPLS
jgi:hypothetical protein